MSRELTQADILDIIPHRFENRLLDFMSVTGQGDEDRAGTGTLCFNADDEEGRGIFTVQSKDGEICYNPYMLMEFFALGAITLMEEKVKQGLTAVFSSIRKVGISRPVPAGKKMTSSVAIKSVNSGFHRFVGTIASEGDDVCSLEVMAYGVDFSEQSDEGKQSTKRISLESSGIDEPVESALFAYKQPAMVFADSVTAFSSESRSLTTEYTYPEDHPFTKGHFPGNPVMMGVTQVMMISDAVELLAGKLGVSGDITGEGVILREDGAVVTEVKGLTLGFNGTGTAPEVKAIKNVAFRDMVAPGETIYCQATIK